MKVLRLIQLENSDQGTIGVLIVAGKVECFTLQPDSQDKKFHIPQGSYFCKRFHGQKWKDTFEIRVPGHTALLFHAGNTEADTQGCILLGESTGYLNGKRAVLSSGKAFEEFMQSMGEDLEANLFIESIGRL